MRKCGRKRLCKRRKVLLQSTASQCTFSSSYLMAILLRISVSLSTAAWAVALAFAARSYCLTLADWSAVEAISI